MKNLFVPYEQSLALKELGFDDLCLGYYHKDKPTLKFGEGFELVTRERYRNEMHYPLKNSRYEAGNNAPDGYYYLITAPTFSQAFRWFMENKSLRGYIIDTNMFESYSYIITDKINKTFINNGFDYNTYEDAEIECLKELIKLCGIQKV